jgi:hypothetical protein
MTAPAIRPDLLLRSLDVPAAITRGLAMTGGGSSHALFTEAAIAASMQAAERGIGQVPLAFLARYVRTAGVAAALDLPEPLAVPDQADLVRDWLTAALTAGSSVSHDLELASWLERVAILIALRRRDEQGRS